MEETPPKPPEGWVTLAVAAQALTLAGDDIDPSSVSRYVDRWSFPSKKLGKYRYVDPAALKKHRDENVHVGDKRTARGLTVEPQPAPLLRPPASIAPQTEAQAPEAEAEEGSPINRANLQLKQLQIRNQEMDLAEREGRLIKGEEVLAVLSGTMKTMIDEFERAEGDIAQQFGREVSAAFRKNRKAAQAKASAKLIELAKKHLPAALALAVVNEPVKQEAAA